MSAPLAAAPRTSRLDDVCIDTLRFRGDRGDVLGVERFGASAPGKVVLREYGFTVDNVCGRALQLQLQLLRAAPQRGGVSAGVRHRTDGNARTTYS